MGKSTRRMKRNKYLSDRKKTEKELTEKLNMFDRLPDSCLTCEKDFDKKNKKMVKEWFVIVRNEENSVNLYCPECWEVGMEIAQGFREKIMEKMKNDTKDDGPNV
jgi:hypothetical protein